MGGGHSLGSVVIRILSRVFKQVLLQIRVRGWRRLSRLLSSGEPLIFVSNHIGSFGPVSVLTSLPAKLYPWVAQEVTELKKVARHLQLEFTELELKLKPPLSVWLARLIGRICVALMRNIEAIPVYSGSRRIHTTLQRSLELLLAGKNILVFPEDKERPINEVLGDFNTGFLAMARLYYQKTRKLIRFLPVAVNAKMKAIKIGNPIRFDVRRPFLQEKQRLKRRLQEAIYALYYSMEEPAPEPQAELAEAP
jgi:1-acyl-sn-glycerol-3-phosphate acyltransferase